MSGTKKALILGVGSAQKDAIKYLKKTGWLVIGCSYRSEGPGFGLVDRFEPIDILDGASLLQLAQNEAIGLVYSVGSDVAMPIVSEIAQTLGLPSLVEPQTARLMQNKVMFRDYLNSNNISRMAWRKVSSPEDLHGWSIFPAFVKPACSQGQRGVFQVSTRQEAIEKIPGVIRFSSDGYAIIEQYLDGREVSCNLFLIDGEIVFSIYSNRAVVENMPGGLPKSHGIPAFLSEKEASESGELIERMVTALKLKNGPVYIQLKITSNGPKIIEAAPRLDGCHLWRLIKMSTGVDLMAATFNLLQGKTVKDALKQTHNAAHNLEFIYEKPGCRFDGDSFDVPHHAVFSEGYYKEGEKIRAVNGVFEKVGYFIQREVTGKI